MYTIVVVLVVRCDLMDIFFRLR